MNITLVSAAAPTIVSLLDGMSNNDKRASTITRMLFRLFGFESSLNEGLAMSTVYMGVGIASQEALALGETALPDINVFSDRPRLGWYTRDHMMVPSSSASVIAPIPLGVIRSDVRSMRKLENGELYLTMASSTVLGLGFDVAIRGLVRTLVRLP